MTEATGDRRRFGNKVALVVGGSRGIGLAAAKRFAAEGAKVVIAARDEKSGQAALEDIRALGEACFVQADLGDPESVKAMIAATVETYGGLDIAYNNAALIGKGSLPIWDADEEDFEKVIAANVSGMWYATKYQFREMMKRGGGAICICGSATSIRGIKEQPLLAYVTSKHAIMGLVKQAAIGGAPNNIRVNAILPGLIETELAVEAWEKMPEGKAKRLAQIPLGRMGAMDEVASAILFLCSDDASYITGTHLLVDGGSTI